MTVWDRCHGAWLASRDCDEGLYRYVLNRKSEKLHYSWSNCIPLLPFPISMSLFLYCFCTAQYRCRIIHGIMLFCVTFV